MSTKIPYVIEEPEPLIEGSKITYSIQWQGGSSLSSPSATVWMNDTEITSTAMPSGTHSVSGNVQTLKELVTTVGHGGNKYVVVIECVVDGNTERVKMIVPVLRQSEAK